MTSAAGTSLQLQREVSGLHTGDVEEVSDQAVHVVRGNGDLVSDLSLRPLQAQDCGQGDNGRERIAEVVSDDTQDIIPCLSGLLGDGLG